MPLLSALVSAYVRVWVWVWVWVGGWVGGWVLFCGNIISTSNNARYVEGVLGSVILHGIAY
jgi:hypothetical protein